MPRSKKPTPDDEQTAFLKRELIDRIRYGMVVPVALASLCCNWRHLQRWVKDETFRDELEAAKASRNLKSHVYYSPDDIKYLKAHLCHLMAEEAMTLSQALKSSGVGWTTIGKWRRDDPGFDAAINEAQLLLTEREADRLKDLHTEILDPRVARVASDNLKTWLEWRNAKFRPKPPLEEKSQELTQILRAAVQRLIEMTPPPAAPIDADAQPAPAKQVRFNRSPHQKAPDCLLAPPWGCRNGDGFRSRHD